jgi:diphthine synthase
MTLGELVFVGLGLHDETGITLRGVEEIKNADVLFAELYTSLMPDISLERLEEIAGKKVMVVSRRVLEEERGDMILKRAEKQRVALLVPGDPLIATTHIDLRIQAEKRQIKTRVVHGASVISAIIGLSGLQNYKYGRSVTIPFHDKSFVSETPYNVISENKREGLHTLCFLDINTEEKKYMSVKEGLQLLLAVEKIRGMNVVTPDTLVLGVARAGSRKPSVKAGYTKDILTYEFGEPPHSMVFPGKLHFVEAKALITLAQAPEEVTETLK